MSRRTLSRAFRCSECAFRTTGKGITIQPRSFSSSSIRRKHGAIPSFTEVSSPELHELLTTLRERVFLPAHVSEGQRDLIFKKKHKQSLEAEPVTAIIAGEEFTLKPLDATTDIPGKTSSVAKALALMKEKRDWDNLPNLMQGLVTSGFPKSGHYTGRLARKIVVNASRAGREEVLLECLRRGHETGFTLRDPEIAVHVLYTFRRKANLSDWDPEATKKALRWAEMTIEMTEDPKHQPADTSKKVADLREVNGFLLELAAVRAAKHQHGKDVEGKVEKYATALLASPQDFIQFPDHSDKAAETNKWLVFNVPIAHGLKVAQTVLDPSSDTSKGLKKLSAKLGPLLLEAKNEVAKFPTKSGNPRHGPVLYEQLLGSSAS